ncbi:hypothetical protein AVEN_90484-1, partial [Araneus ventricosus]
MGTNGIQKDKTSLFLNGWGKFSCLTWVIPAFLPKKESPRETKEKNCNVNSMVAYMFETLYLQRVNSVTSKISECIRKK